MGRLWRGMGGDRPPHRQHGFMHFTRHETRITAFGVLKPFSLFFGGSRFRLRVMTPLLGTKNPSAPVGAAPAGDRRAGRATDSKVFHETRDTGLLGAPRKPARIPRFSRNTRHETRITAFMLFLPRFPGISRYFPVKKLLPTKCPRALRQLGNRLDDQSVVKSRLAPGTALRPADEARPESIWDLFDREATQFSRDASPLECREAFATGCNEEVSWR